MAFKRFQFILFEFFLFLFAILLIGVINFIMGWPFFDVIFMLILAGLLTIGDQWSASRFICFSITLFFVDISPGFILLPFILYLIANNKKGLIKKFFKYFLWYLFTTK